MWVWFSTLDNETEKKHICGKTGNIHTRYCLFRCNLISFVNFVTSLQSCYGCVGCYHWGNWLKGVWEFSVLFFQLLYKPKIIAAKT